MHNLVWCGPYRLQDLVEKLLDMTTEVVPPMVPGVYFLSEKPWRIRPDLDSQGLYIGESDVLRGRLGSLMQDLMGFYGEMPSGEWVGRHVVWQVRDDYTARNLKIGEAYIGWAVTPPMPCHRCIERELIDMLPPKFPPRKYRRCCCP